ncbi:unnamed protein product [Trichobilharzia regenti]|nr:unnamed protein product [Trichobilharzia regenti]
MQSLFSGKILTRCLANNALRKNSSHVPNPYRRSTGPDINMVAVIGYCITVLPLGWIIYDRVHGIDQVPRRE